MADYDVIIVGGGIGGSALASDDGSPAALRPYAEERAERMRRLRFAASIQAARGCAASTSCS
jgi:hypothetical protein